MSIRDGILNASMREMVEFARMLHKRSGHSDDRLGDLMEDLWSWAEELETKEPESDVTEAPEVAKIPTETQATVEAIAEPQEPAASETEAPEAAAEDPQPPQNVLEAARKHAAALAARKGRGAAPTNTTGGDAKAPH